MRYYYIILFALLYILTSCGITSYRTFEISNTNDYGRKTVYIDSLIEFKVGVSLYDYNRSLIVYIEGLLKCNSDLIVDSITVNIVFPHTELVQANYMLTNMFINNNDTIADYKSFKSIPLKVKTFSKAGKSILYGLTYWDLTRPNIAKSIKNIALEICVNYKIKKIAYKKIFNVDLLSKTHRDLWIIRDG
jgi:hypothetical protein